MAENIYCPKCGTKLNIVDGKRRYCEKCKMPYILTGNTIVVDKKAKKRHPFRALLMILALLLLGTAGGFLTYYYLFIGSHTRYIEQEYLAYRDRVSEDGAEFLSATEASGPNELKKGDPVQIIGIVEESGDSVITLNNGVICNYLLDMPGSPTEAGLRSALEEMHPGDVVRIDGMISGTDPFTVKYCSLPYLYQEGSKFYIEYENFRKGIKYPDTVYSEEEYQTFQDTWLGAADPSVPLWTAEELLDSFRAADGRVTEESFAGGADAYRDSALRVMGKITEIGGGYFVVDGVSCFYSPSLLQDHELEAVQALEVTDFVEVYGLVSNPSVDAFRMKYCQIEDHHATREVSRTTGAVSAAIHDVLTGEAALMNYGHIEAWHVSEPFSHSTVSRQYSTALADDQFPGVTLTTERFAVVDLNGDGANEVILQCTDRRQFSQGSSFCAHVILHEYNGTVYGYMVQGDIQNFMKNGLLMLSSGDGQEYCYRFAFRSGECGLTEEVSYGENSTILGEAATDEQVAARLRELEYYDDTNSFNSANEVEFYDFTDENIQSLSVI